MDRGTTDVFYERNTVGFVSCVSLKKVDDDDDRDENEATVQCRC